MGDAVLVRVTAAEEAVGLGIRIVDDIGGRHEFPVVRVGMQTGPAIRREADWFCATVNLAARVAAAADGGEVLLTEGTKEAVANARGVAFDDCGEHRLRNVSAPVRLYRARAPGGPPLTLPIDPVCRMAVAPSDSIRLDIGRRRVPLLREPMCRCVRGRARRLPRYPRQAGAPTTRMSSLASAAGSVGVV